MWDQIRIALFGLAVLYLQVLFAPSLSVFGVVPSLMLAYVVFSVLNLSLVPAMTFIFLLGVMQDLTTPTMLGVNVFCYLLLALIINNVHHSLDKEKFLSHLIIISGVNLLYYVIYFFVQLIASGYSTKLVPILLFSIIYNITLSGALVFILTLLNRMKVQFDED